VINPRDIISSVIFYGGVLALSLLLIHVGSTYGWQKVHERYRAMEPRLHRGHYVWINKRARRPESIDHNDIIMYRRPLWKHAPYTYEFGRVIGKPGDVVELRDNAKIYRAVRREGKLGPKESLTEHYVSELHHPEEFSEFIVPRNTIFVMPDRRTVRPPLRNLLVPIRSIYGKVIR